MKKDPTEIGMNRTGIAMSPLDGSATARGAEEAMPTSDGGEAALARVRAEFAADSDPIGSMPPPVTVRGVVTTIKGAVKGERLSVLLDKLGERLAFERTATRMYEAVIDKLPHIAQPRGPTLPELSEIQEDELRHVEILRQAILQLGGDPTALTPCADVAGVASTGLLQTVSDPRTRLPECLNALMMAELADNASWELLIDLCGGLGEEQLISGFQEALAEEQEHLLMVRRWLSFVVMAAAGVSADERAPAPTGV